MKKFALAIGFAAYIVFGTQSTALAAHRSDSTTGFVAMREASAAWAQAATTFYADWACIPY